MAIDGENLKPTSVGKINGSAGSNDEIATFTGYGDDIYEDGTYRYKVEIKDADGSIDTIYTAGMTVTGR